MSESDFLIVSIAPPQSTEGGDFTYRLKQPYEALGSLPGVTALAVTNVISSREYLLRNADLLIIHLLGDSDLIPIVYERKKSGLPTVFEISDNLLNFQPGNPASAFYENPESRATLLKLISIADAVQTSTEPLAEIYSRFNPNMATFVNQMTSVGVPEEAEGPVTVGWGGSDGHFEDIKEIAPYIADWVNSRDDVKFSLMAGLRFKPLFSNIPASKFTWLPPGTLEQYYEFVQSLHVGIAPIRDDEFNRCRSDVKFMEYASRGVVPVCTNAPTYSRTLRNGETGFLFNSPEELISTLNRLADDSALRKKVGLAAYEYIKNERSEIKAAGKKLEFYRGLVSNARSEGGEVISSDYLSRKKSLKKSAGADFYLHKQIECEKLCHEGMIELFENRNAAKAQKLFDKALEKCTDYYSVALYRGMASMKDRERAYAFFYSAETLQPELFMPILWKYRVLKSGGLKAEAYQCAQEMSERFPYMVEAQLSAAEAESAAGNNEGAISRLEAAVSANPWHMNAAVILAQTYNEQGRFEDAALALKDISELYPKFETPSVIMGEALTALEKFAEAAESFLRALKINAASETARVGILKAVKELYKRKDFTEALKYVVAASELAPDSKDINFWADRIKMRSGV